MLEQRLCHFVSRGVGWLQHPFSCSFVLLCPPQGVEVGIIVSVCVSLLLVIYKTAFPRITTLGKLPGTEIYR